MTGKQFTYSPILGAFAVAVAFFMFSAISAPAQRSMTAAKILYKVKLVDFPSRTVTVIRTGSKIDLKLEGFGKRLVVPANGGGTETCRTIISNSSGGSKIVLSLPIPLPNTPCQMTPGTLLIEGDKFGVTVDEKEVAKVSGNDGQLRNAVERSFGKIQAGGQ